MRSNNNKYSSGRQKQKDIQQKQQQSKNPSKNSSKSRRLSSAGCTPPPPPLHPSSTSDDHTTDVRHINQRNQQQDRREDPQQDIAVSTDEYNQLPRSDDIGRRNDDDDNFVDGHHHHHHHHHHERSRFVGTAIRRNFAPRDRTSYYPFRVMGGLGIAQIFLGLLAVSMQLVALFVSEPTSFIGAGIWSGLFFVAAGTLAVVSTRRKGGRGRVSWSIGVMVVSIFAILVALGMLAVASIGLHLTSNFQYNTEYPLSWKVLESLLVVIALVEGLVAFLTSIMACKGIALNCRVPKQIGAGTESTALYMLVPNNGAGVVDGHTVDLPQSLEVRHLQVAGSDALGFRVGTLERRTLVDAIAPDPPQRSGHPYSLSRPSSMHRHGNVLLDGDDFEPPPAYSERI